MQPRLFVAYRRKDDIDLPGMDPPKLLPRCHPRCDWLYWASYRYPSRCKRLLEFRLTCKDRAAKVPVVEYRGVIDFSYNFYRIQLMRIAMPRATHARLTLLVAATMSGLPGANANPNDAVLELIVLPIESASSQRPFSASDIRASVASNDRDQRQRAVVARLGSPAAAQFLVGKRLSEQIELAPNTPAELLERYVVLRYPTRESAEAAFTSLSRDRAIQNVEWNETFEFSVDPSDPLYFPDFYSPRYKDYQWGMNGAMNFATAWDKTPGTAYVALLDFGIDVSHPDLTQAYRPQFAYSATDYAQSADEELNTGTTFRGHGTHVAGIIAGNANNPSVAGGMLNPASLGTAGGCWNCSLIPIRITATNGSISVSGMAAGIQRAVSTGAQVINLSFGAASQTTNCSSTPDWGAVCNALQLAYDRDVVVVAAAGNSGAAGLQFPARDSRVLPVAGVTNSGAHWTEGVGFGSSTGAELQTRGVAAPAQDIVSTFTSGKVWNPYFRCGDQQEFPVVSGYSGLQKPDPVGDGDNVGAGYGRCTGTSMAAPHISAAVGLMRSADPLVNRATVVSRLRASGSLSSSPNQELGAGVPNVGVAVSSMLIGTNRLTPLLAFRDRNDYRYTVAPQMGTAFSTADFSAVYPTACDKMLLYPTNVGTSISELPLLPGTSVVPKAQIWVFGGSYNPKNASQPLVPIIRVSRRAVWSGSSCTAGEIAYDTNESRVQSLLNQGYKRDGVEGFLFSPQFAQPGYTVAVYRATNPTTGDNALYPSTEQAAMTAAGYTSGVVLAGYGYLNGGPRPVIK